MPETKRSFSTPSQLNIQDRFIEHLLQEIDRLHTIIVTLAPSRYGQTPKVLYDPADVLAGKSDLFAEDPVQVQQLYKDMGVTEKELNA